MRPIKWNCTSEQYHADPSLGQSSLKLFVKEPELFHDKFISRTAPPEEQRPYFQFGTDFERLVFYGELPGVLIPDEVLSRSERDGKVVLSRRGAAWREFEARAISEHGEGVRLLKIEEWDKDIAPLLIARDRLREHERARRLIYGAGVPHIALRWTDPATGIACKCQLDILHGSEAEPIAIVDLKTAAAVDRKSFERAIVNFGYDVQAEWYSRAVSEYLSQPVRMIFVVVKNKPPYNVETYDLDEEWYRLGAAKIEAGMARLKRAYDENDWKTETHGRVITLKPPRWAWSQFEDY